MSHESFDAAMNKTGVVATQTGGGISLYGWFASQDPLTLLGIVIAVAGLALQVWYTLQRNQRDRARELREQIEHQAKMHRFHDGGHAP
jgi:hypothetical protein